MKKELKEPKKKVQKLESVDHESIIKTKDQIILSLQNENLILQRALERARGVSSDKEREKIVGNMKNFMDSQSSSHALRYANTTFTRDFLNAEPDMKLKSMIAKMLLKYFENNKAANVKIWESFI